MSLFHCLVLMVAVLMALPAAFCKPPGRYEIESEIRANLDKKLTSEVSLVTEELRFTVFSGLSHKNRSFRGDVAFRFESQSLLWGRLRGEGLLREVLSPKILSSPGKILRETHGRISRKAPSPQEVSLILRGRRKGVLFFRSRNAEGVGGWWSHEVAKGWDLSLVCLSSQKSGRRGVKKWGFKGPWIHGAVRLTRHWARGQWGGSYAGVRPAEPRRKGWFLSSFSRTELSRRLWVSHYWLYRSQRYASVISSARDDQYGLSTGGGFRITKNFSVRWESLWKEENYWWRAKKLPRGKEFYKLKTDWRLKGISLSNEMACKSSWNQRGVWKMHWDLLQRATVTLGDGGFFVLLGSVSIPTKKSHSSPKWKTASWVAWRREHWGGRLGFQLLNGHKLSCRISGSIGKKSDGLRFSFTGGLKNLFSGKTPGGSPFLRLQVSHRYESP